MPITPPPITNIQIINNFTTHNPDKAYCVLGVLANPIGLEIEKVMLSKLTPKYDVISVRQDPPGIHFEYPAINHALTFAKENDCPVLYLHTKGAGNPNAIQPMVRSVWYDEFVGNYDGYMRLLKENEGKPMVITPFTGTRKITWFNAFFVNPTLANVYNVPYHTNRLEYEALFKHSAFNVISPHEENVDQAAEAFAILRRLYKRK